MVEFDQSCSSLCSCSMCSFSVIFYFFFVSTYLPKYPRLLLNFLDGFFLSQKNCDGCNLFWMNGSRTLPCRTTFWTRNITALRSSKSKDRDTLCKSSAPLRCNTWSWSTFSCYTRKTSQRTDFFPECHANHKKKGKQKASSLNIHPLHRRIYLPYTLQVCIYIHQIIFIKHCRVSV